MVIAAAATFDELPQKKKKKSKSKGDPLPLALNNNIIEHEILPRLPAKSICRFKCVSKQWKLFLSTHMFGNMHHLHHINNVKTYKLLLLDKPRVHCCEPLNHGSVTVGFNPLEAPDPRFDLVLASLDGLVCVASTKNFSSLALWNPFTGAYYKLPSNPNFMRPYDSSNDVIGFYSNDDYKLLYLAFGGAIGAFIYSQRLNSWRKIEFFIENYDKFCFYEWSPATLCDHGLYFSVFRHDTDHRSIICFDVNTEDFRVIQFPALPNGARCYHASLVVLDGYIHLCVAYFTCSIDYVSLRQGNMWKLNGDDGAWVEVAFFPGAPYDVDFVTKQRHICITRNARDSWLAILEGSTSFEVMNMEEFTLQNSWSWTYSRIIYHETLVSPNP